MSDTNKENLLRIANACADALAGAYSSMLVAKDMAGIGDLPLVNQIDELSGRMYGLMADAKQIRQQVEDATRCPTQELPSFEAELSPLERDLWDRMRVFGLPMRIDRGSLGWSASRVLVARNLIHSLPNDPEWFTVTKYLPIGEDGESIPVSDGLYRMYHTAMSGKDIVVNPNAPHADLFRKTAEKLVAAGVMMRVSENVYRAVKEKQQ
jgi:hypothetical protein